MALLRQHSCVLTPFRTPAVTGVSGGRDPLRVFRPPGPLHWTPTPALSISISFLSQYVSRWRPMQDRCFNIGSALTYNNYRSVQPLFKPSTPLFASTVLCLSGGLCFVFFRRPPRRCFGREFKTSSSHWWKWLLSLIRNWSSLFNSTSIGHCNWASRGDAAGMRRNNNKTAGLWRKAFG